MNLLKNKEVLKEILKLLIFLAAIPTIFYAIYFCVIYSKSAVTMPNLKIDKLNYTNNCISISGDCFSSAAVYRGNKYKIIGSDMYITIYSSIGSFSKKATSYFDVNINGNFEKVERIYIRRPDYSKDKAVINFARKYKDRLIWLKNNASSDFEAKDYEQAMTYNLLFSANKDKAEIAKELQNTIELYKSSKAGETNYNFRGSNRLSADDYPIIKSADDFEITISEFDEYDIKVTLPAAKRLLSFYINKTYYQINQYNNCSANKYRWEIINVFNDPIYSKYNLSKN